ncbi:MAG: DUF4160 domain-containing protein [Actinomycetota bacterium]|nr:DUF4160 domain-containing protein [Actinomycetota bacterium]
MNAGPTSSVAPTRTAADGKHRARNARALSRTGRRGGAFPEGESSVEDPACPLCPVNPTCAFYGIVIFMYRPDHPPPHFHAQYGEYVALEPLVPIDPLA